MNRLIQSFTSLSLLVLLFLINIAAPVNVFSQTAVLSRESRPFEPSEELYYEAEFSRSLLRKLDVADFKFSATQTFLNRSAADSVENGMAKRPYELTLSADVTSKGFFTRLFNLNFRERVESIVEPKSFTVQRTTIHDEQGKRVRLTETIFDNEHGKMSWTVRDPNNPAGAPRNITANFSGQMQDILSAIYFIRTQPLAVGHSFEVSIADGGRIYLVPVKVVERKRMKTALGRLNVFELVPDVFGTDHLIDDEKGEFVLWITDDNRRLPVGGRIKTEYGTFDIRLKRAVYKPTT